MQIARNFQIACVVVMGAVGLCGDWCAPIRADEPDLPALLKTFDSEFIAIKPGEKGFPKSFRMGSSGGRADEGPLHEVVMSHPFFMAKYEVPQNLYEAVMGENPSRWKGKRNSVEMFNYSQAVEFCQKITRLLREAQLLTAEEEIRLPTEAEWEYCCRAGTTTTYSFGNSAVKAGDAGNKASVLDEYGWHTGNAAGNDPPVGAKKPNPWGFYDMHGYLWEFVSDGWHANYEGAPADGRSWDPSATDRRRVIRGGSWKNRFEALSSASRQPVDEATRDEAIGLRCVKARVPAQ
jgi:formylglycine-generating enzyme required for sulfatase activity